jgi:hypothetical protein
MKETLITFETAKLAKEKGFNHIKPNCVGDNKAYEKDGILICANKGNTQSGYILAPTQSLLQRWLREKHNLHIELIIDLSDDLETMCFRGFHIIKINKYKNLYQTSEVFKTYEEVLERGLQETLKLIE